MAPAADYLFLSIETLVNSVSLVIMVPCMLTLLRTQGIHDNCELLLITSAFVNTLILIVQTLLFAYNFITENLMSEPIGGQFPEHERPFLMVQNTLFTMSSYISFVLVLERTVAVSHAAEYEKSCRHLLCLFSLITGSLAISMLTVYAIHFHNLIYVTIAVTNAVEACTLIISIVLIIYARRKLLRIPFGEDRLKAMYQVKEVLNFSLAILPSVVVSSVMHTLSLVPTMLWQAGAISYPVCCLVYFSVHSLNCIFTKLVLIGCHKSMRQRFRLLFCSRRRSASTSPVIRDTEQETREYFDHIKAAWESVPVKREKTKSKWKVYKAMKSISAMCLLLWLCSILFIAISADITGDRINGFTATSTMDLARFLGYNHLNVIDLLKAITDDEKYEGRHSYVIYCQYAYCHGQNDTKCNGFCEKFGSNVDKHVYGERVSLLSGKTTPHVNVQECTRVCASDCGKNECGKECAALCHKHFSFMNKKEYEIELNQFIGMYREERKTLA